MIAVYSDWTEVEAELDRLSVMPSSKAMAALDGVLAAGLALVVADTHVITGSLKSSAKTDTEKSHVTGTWTGTIEMGGVSAGINNPVDYAIYEQRRGGAHDFFADLPTLHPAYIAAIEGALQG